MARLSMTEDIDILTKQLITSLTGFEVMRCLIANHVLT